jgi:hypothetical protein
MSGGSLSQECVEGRHAQCPIQCHPGTAAPQTFVGETKSVEDTKVL